jgi:hypothetical protein
MITIEVGQIKAITIGSGVVSDYTFSSTQTSIATVDNRGVVTGMAPGDAQIFVTNTALGKVVKRFDFSVVPSANEIDDPNILVSGLVITFNPSPRTITYDWDNIPIPLLIVGQDGSFAPETVLLSNGSGFYQTYTIATSDTKVESATALPAGEHNFSLRLARIGQNGFNFLFSTPQLLNYVVRIPPTYLTNVVSLGQIELEWANVDVSAEISGNSPNLIVLYDGAFETEVGVAHSGTQVVTPPNGNYQFKLKTAYFDGVTRTDGPDLLTAATTVTL